MNCSEMKFLRGLGKFQITDMQAEHIIPVSGGVDSSALVLLLHERFPEINFRLCFSDTGAESPITYKFLESLEEKLGKKIERILPQKDLWALIEEYNGYLPSAQSRWCTRELKLKSFQKWIAQFEGKKVYMYVGIRSDESSRIGFSIDGVETVFPYVEAGWKRNDVFGFLAARIGIPRTYMTRARSGCSVCPFVRRQEVVGLLQHDPAEFERGASYEKLIDSDKERHGVAYPLWKDSGMGANWLALPKPQDGDKIVGRRALRSDLLGTNGIFVAAEFFEDSMPGMPAFTWHQRIISYSNVLGKLQQQVDDRYQHLLSCAEVYDMSPEDVRSKTKFALYYVEMPSDTLDVDGPTKGSYTWQSGQSYAQVRHIIGWVERSLAAYQVGKDAKKEVKNLLSVQYEWRQAAQAAQEKVQAGGVEVGAVLGSQWYQPKEKARELDIEEEFALLPCPMCNI